MLTIRHILFPLDFSAAGTAAVPYVRAMANRFHAKVTILSVVPPAWVSPPGIVGPAAVSDPATLQNALQEHLNKLAIDGLEAAPARLTALGDPAEKIAEFTRDHAVDLVMIPTHGHSLFRRLLLGSVASKVLHDVHCPVWTAAHAEKQHAGELPRKILCAVDGSSKSVAIAQWAADFSRQIGATMLIIHVVRPISDWLSLESEQTLQDELRAESRSRLDNMLRTGLQPAGTEFSLRIAVGEIVNTITEHAREEDADLIVLGRGAIENALGRLRTHAHGIIQHSPSPVVSV
jgi:nucleotide-binding universal stress UspA family protein